MEPVHYFRLVRRRWKLVVILTVLGGLAGMTSSLLGGRVGEPERIFLAQHTLRDEGPTNETAGVNLDLAAFLLTSPPVPDRVSAAIGGDPLDLRARIAASPEGTLRTLDVYAVDRSANRAEEIADEFAAQLGVLLQERDRGDRDDQLADLETDLARHNQRRQELLELAPTLEGDELVQNDAALVLLATDIASVASSLDELRRQDLPSDQLETLAPAAARPVTRQELNQVITGLDAKNPTTQTPTLGFGGTSSTDTPGLLDHPAVRGLAGALFGFLSALALAVTINRFDPRLRNKEDAEEALGLPIIAEVPPLPRGERAETHVISFSAPRSPTAEAYRALRSSLVFIDAEQGADGSATSPGSNGSERTGRVIMVTSPGPGEGKTTSAANLAAVLAEAGFSVLAVNCDFRKPRLHKYLNAENTPRHVVDTAIPGVRMVTDVVSDSSRVNPAEIVAAQRRLIENARGLFDIIVLDTAPLLTTNDAVDLLPEADLVVVFCRAGKTTREAAQRTAEVLRRHGAPMAGGALVGVDEGPSARYYYYYGDSQASATDTAPPEAVGAGTGPTSARR